VQSRQEEITYEEVCVKLKNCFFTWGYLKNEKVGEEAAENIC
jgi:ATP-binding cassette subfamily C (CFTR/MRP) protein 1